MRVGIIGAGSMGTAIAILLARKGHEVVLWARREEVVRNINEKHVNFDYFPDIVLPREISATSELSVVLGPDVVFLAVPSRAIGDVALRVRDYAKGKILVNTAKGIHFPPFRRLSEILREILPESRLVVLSGPNFASEIAKGLPAGTTLASDDNEALEIVKHLLESPSFIVQTTDDVVGVELSGALKNVYAIAMGICEALGLNENAYFFILNEAYLEMTRIIVHLGGREESLTLSSGFGDLCLTANSNKSRNRVLGFLAGKNMLSESEGNSKIIFEGKKTVRAVKHLCDKDNLECPIADFVYRVIIEKRRPYNEYLRLWENLYRRYL